VGWFLSLLNPSFIFSTLPPQQQQNNPTQLNPTQIPLIFSGTAAQSQMTLHTDPSSATCHMTLDKLLSLFVSQFPHVHVVVGK
jgi:hypothetical protein